MAKLKPERKLQVLHSGGSDVPEGAKILIAPQEGPQWDLMLLEEKEILFGGAKGGGKALCKSSVIKTLAGFVPFWDIKVGSRILNPTGEECTVIGVYPQGLQRIFKLTLRSGESIKATLDHLWLAKAEVNGVRESPLAQQYYDGVIVSTKTLMSFLADGGKPCLPRSLSLGEVVWCEILNIVEVDAEEARCIKVDHPNHLFIADENIVTHNTAGARIWALKGNPYESQKVPVNVSYVYHSGYRCLVLRKNVKDMHDYIDKAKLMYGPAYGAIWNGDGFFEFPSGAKIVIGHMADENSYMQYMGQEWTRIIIEEVTQIASVTLFLRVLSCCRTVYPEMKTQILLTANPEGPGFHWVRQRYMTDPRTGKRVPPKTRIEEVIENPFTGKKEVITRVFLPSKVSDNKILLQNDPGYVALLMSLPENLKQAYLEGNWDVLGGKYFSEFRAEGPMEGEPTWASHCVESTSVWMMPWFKKWCGLDIGYHHWMVCHWFFESEDDNRVYVYRTLRTRYMGLQEFGMLWAKHALQDFGPDSNKAITIWMSHDAFHKRDSSPESEDISPVHRFLRGVEMVLGPKAVFIATQEDVPTEPDYFEREAAQREARVIIRKAPMHRQSSSEYVRELMAWRKPQLQEESYDQDYALKLITEEGGGEKYLRYLQRHIVAGKDPQLPRVRIFSDKCPALVQQIGDAVYDEDRLNIMKVDCNPDTGEGGDDDLQAFVYGLSGYRIQTEKVSNEPAHVRMQKRVHEILKRHDFQLDGSQVMQVRWQAWAETKESDKFKTIHVPRRSSKWFRPKPEKPWDEFKNVLQ